MRKCCNKTLQFKVIGLFGKEEWALIFKNANITQACKMRVITSSLEFDS